MNYLTVDVYRSAGIDCTNNGVTSETSPTFVVPCEHGPISGDWADEQEYVILVPGTSITYSISSAQSPLIGPLSQGTTKVGDVLLVTPLLVQSMPALR